jgi:indole-3-glycerol phosphate synthase
MADILSQIYEVKREEVRRLKKQFQWNDFTDFELFAAERADFAGSLKHENRIGIIAEIKKASPSKGIIRPDFDALKIAEQYTEAGADAISVLTDEHFFQGNISYLSDIKKRFPTPLLRKDFIIHPLQLMHARAAGADAILLIAAMLDPVLFRELQHVAAELGLAALLELHDESEVSVPDWNLASIVGVNNRNLKTFEVDVERGIKLLQSLPKSVIRVAESGISKAIQVEELFSEGVNTVLVGETFMRKSNPGDGVKEFLEPFLNKS